jgi:hypothetical protein
MKRFLLLIATSMMVSLLPSVSGQTFTEYLPGGKNYIDPENMTMEYNVIHTIDSIKVKADTDYTLTIPGRDLLGNLIVIDIHGMDTYIDEGNMDSLCQTQDQWYVCNFTTSTQETSISVSIEAENTGMYYDYYQVDSFQLEEGSVSTDFEEYMEPYIDITAPDFSGTGAIVVSYDEDRTLLEILHDSIMVWDEVDGDLTNQIQVLSDSYTDNSSLVGQYPVDIKVSDSSGNQSVTTIILMVKDEVAPHIIGPNDISVDVNDGVGIDSIVDQYLAIYDTYDTELIRTYTINEYSPNMMYLGSYEVVLEVSDQQGNTASHSMTISVIDSEAPSVSGNLEFTVDIDDTVSLESIIETLTITDNYDTVISISVVNDTYSINADKIGIYSVDLRIEDTSNNTKDFSISIEVYDQKPPLIVGPSSITISYEEPLSMEEILALFTITDNETDSINLQVNIIQDSYSIRASLTGEYFIEFQVMDNSQNLSQHRIDIYIIDTIPPIIFLDQSNVVLSPSVSFTKYDALQLLKESGNLEDKEYQITVVTDEYTEYKEIPGEYTYIVEFMDDAGNTFTKEFQIIVQEEESQNNYLMGIIGLTFLVSFGGYWIIKK